METIKITNEFITLGQLLKYENIVESGGMAKAFLIDFRVLVNGKQDQRRGRKLYPGDVIEIEDFTTYKISTE